MLGSFLSLSNDSNAKIGMKIKRCGRSMKVIKNELITAQMIYARLILEKNNPNIDPLICFLLCLRINALYVVKSDAVARPFIITARIRSTVESYMPAST